MAITQLTRFKSDKPEEMIKTAKQAKTIFEKHGAEFLSAVPVPHRHVGRGVAHCYALRQLGSLRQDARGSGEGRGIREAVGTYSYLCPTDGPQHHRRRRSLTTTQCGSRNPMSGLREGAQCSVRILTKVLLQPPGKPSSRGSGCSVGNPLATWRTIAMISCTISPRAPPVAPLNEYPTAARISALASSGPANSQTS
jgi:hypothetical protein